MDAVAIFITSSSLSNRNCALSLTNDLLSACLRHMEHFESEHPEESFDLVNIPNSF